MQMVISSPKPIVGIFWMLITGLCFVAVTAIVKYMGPRVPPAEAAFLRYLLGLVFLFPMLSSVRTARLSRRQWGLFALRGIFHTAGVILWFFCYDPNPDSRSHCHELPCSNLRYDRGCHFFR